MATTTIADYQILRDTNITLSGDHGVPFAFQVPSDLFISDSTGRGGILAFKMRVAERTDLRILFGGAQVLRSTFDPSHTRGYWECFRMRESLFLGDLEQRELEVMFQTFFGEITISDVVAWYQIKR